MAPGLPRSQHPGRFPGHPHGCWAGDLALPRVKAQAPLHQPVCISHENVFAAAGCQHFCGCSQMFLTVLDRSHGGSFRGFSRSRSTTVDPLRTQGEGCVGALGPELCADIHAPRMKLTQWWQLPLQAGLHPGGWGLRGRSDPALSPPAAPWRKVPQFWFLVTSEGLARGSQPGGLRGRVLGRARGSHPRPGGR